MLLKFQLLIITSHFLTTNCNPVRPVQTVDSVMGLPDPNTDSNTLGTNTDGSSINNMFTSGSTTANTFNPMDEGNAQLTGFNQPNSNEAPSGGAMTYLRSTENKLKENKGTNRLGFPSRKELNTKKNPMQDVFDLTDKINPEKERIALKIEERKEKDDAIQAIRNAIIDHP